MVVVGLMLAVQPHAARARRAGRPAGGGRSAGATTRRSTRQAAAGAAETAPAAATAAGTPKAAVAAAGRPRAAADRRRAARSILDDPAPRRARRSGPAGRAAGRVWTRPAAAPPRRRRGAVAGIGGRAIRRRRGDEPWRADAPVAVGAIDWILPRDRAARAARRRAGGGRTLDHEAQHPAHRGEAAAASDPGQGRGGRTSGPVVTQYEVRPDAARQAVAHRGAWPTTWRWPSPRARSASRRRSRARTSSASRSPTTVSEVVGFRPLVDETPACSTRPAS